ncbi:substrate-binding domain-containing protein [Paenibacillus hamazuiensis]|uniref:substrate-binding domain-containing protein n=1 Tax=Paenibacillus hamazuiensis TaxID=2936508 RepID=UPI00200EAEBF|nr:substrate-binding domain-containing protein [Paenibacillus hamazuiensis]
MRKLIMVYVLLLACFASYVYFEYVRVASPGAWNEPSQGLKGTHNEKYVLVTFQSGIDYWKNVLKGFEDAAEALDVSVEYRGATQYDVHEEITVLEQVIAKKPAGIAVTAINPDELTSTINKAVEAGIPVVLFDSGASKSKAYSFLATDNYSAGVTAARKMAELTEQQGKIAIITSPGQLNHKERTSGFTDTIRSEFPNMQVVGVENGQGDSIVSDQAARKLMGMYPDLAGIFVTEANGGVGVAAAVSDAGKTGKLKIIGFDTDKGTLDLVKKGAISATLAQGTWNMGYWSLMHLFHLNHNKSQQIPVPPHVDTGITVVTQSNVDQFYAK